MFRDSAAFSQKINVVHERMDSIFSSVKVDAMQMCVCVGSRRVVGSRESMYVLNKSIFLICLDAPFNYT